MDNNQTTSHQLSPRKLLWGIFVHPTQTFTYLKDMGKRTYWITAVLIIILSVAPLISERSLSHQVTVSDISEGFNSKAPYADPMMINPDSASQTFSPTGPSIFKIVGMIPGTILTWFIWAGGLHLASVFLGHSNSFKQMLKLTIWAWIPYAFRGIVQTLYILVTRTSITNPGLSGFIIDKGSQQLIPPGPGKLALASALGHIDVFQIWTVLLLSTGLTLFTGIPQKKARITIFIIWALLIVVSMIIAMIGGMFGQITTMF